ncbi:MULTISPECIES: hypothetical protein [Sphingomonas]|uniref:EF-hand domain-containing protein n=1 Tax=Sphingomonas kyeonggiensis TaxID=1268553 RepID=A0A7W7K2L2_9SPHN|nr:hypothetical protein [Sphingomonas kyeonggiensis]MBB4839428.1 hypothetical protein [Sphingomonas kyeonggiensis]
MMKLKFAALLAASALTFGTGAAMAAPQDRTPPKAEQRAPRHNPMDLNKDGFVSKDEWMKAAAARFEKFDVSKDGKLSREEIRFGRFEQHRMHGRGHGFHRGGRGGPERGPHGGPGFGPGREGPGGPGHHRMGPPPPPPADAPAPAAPAPGN